MGRRLRSGVLPRCFGRHSCRLGVRAHRQRRFTRSLLLSGRFRDCQRRPNVLLVHLFPHTCDPLPVPTRYGDTIAPAAVDARILRRRVTLLATACLVQHYISESIVNVRGRISHDYCGSSIVNSGASHTGGSVGLTLILRNDIPVDGRNFPNVISTSPRSFMQSRTIAVGRSGTGSAWRFSPRRTVQATALSRSMISVQSRQQSTTPALWQNAGAIIADHRLPESAWARSSTLLGRPAGHLITGRLHD